MGLGSAKVTPDGAEPTHDPINATAELNPFIEPTVTVDDAVAP